jgi:hypothetical protein
MWKATVVITRVAGALLIVMGMGFLFVGDYLRGVVSMSSGVGVIIGLASILEHHLGKTEG